MSERHGMCTWEHDLKNPFPLFGHWNPCFVREVQTLATQSIMIKEAELGGDMIGTIKRGIGLCYASKAIHNGLRVGDRRHMDTFWSKLEILFKDAAN
ncbi:unnamed protein product [Sphagnum troendelagicum]